MSIDKQEIQRDLMLAQMIETQAELKQTVAELNAVLSRLADRNNVPATLDAVQVAEMIHTTPKTVRNWAARGKIPCRKINGAVFFVVEEVLEFAKRDK